MDLSLLKHVSPIEWDNVVLYGQYVLNRKLVAVPCSRRLACISTRICLVP